MLLLAPRGSYKLTDVGAWDTLGMRGTCSPGCTVHVETEAFRIMPEPFGEIRDVHDGADLAHPVVLVLARHRDRRGVEGAGGGAGQGARRARRGARAAQRLSDIYRKLQGLRDEVATVAREYDEAHAAREKERLASLGFALRINNLKLTASAAVVEIVGEALGICGIAAYKNDSQLSLGRQLRDAHSAALMISNDRIHDTNASLLLVHKGN